MFLCCVEGSVICKVGKLDLRIEGHTECNPLDFFGLYCYLWVLLA